MTTTRHLLDELFLVYCQSHHLGVHIGQNTLVGAGAVVLPQCRVGRDVVIGAGSVVISNIPDGVVAKGVPARWDLS